MKLSKISRKHDTLQSICFNKNLMVSVTGLGEYLASKTTFELVLKPWISRLATLIKVLGVAMTNTSKQKKKLFE